MIIAVCAQNTFFIPKNNLPVAMTPLVVILTAASYFALLLVLGWLSSRRSGGGNTSFFRGDRRTPWPMVAFAGIGAAISGVTFISVPGMVAAKGYSYLQMVLGFVVGYAVIAYLLVPVFYQQKLLTIYGYLAHRFGRSAHHTGAWIFFVSKMLGASVRFFVVCAVLQLLLFAPLGIPFFVNVAVTISLIWLYTANGGVTTIIWTDMLKSFCLIASVGLCIFYIARSIGLSLSDLPAAVMTEPHTKLWYFDDPMSGLYFWKQFLAGVFMAIATNGLDQDMMQRNMACHDSRAARKNMLLSAVMQVPVVALFLLLGTTLLLYCNHTATPMPEKSDELFGLVATSSSMPAIVGILFVLGLISAAYSAAASALTSLTTTFTVDILDGPNRWAERGLRRIRLCVHVAMSIIMGLVIVAFYEMSSDDAISAVYTLAGYTYGPILGLFAFGMLCRRRVPDAAVPVICIVAPLLTWFTRWWLHTSAGYEVGFELLLINAIFTVALLGAASLVYSSSKSYVEESA